MMMNDCNTTFFYCHNAVRDVLSWFFFCPVIFMFYFEK